MVSSTKLFTLLFIAVAQAADRSSVSSTKTENGRLSLDTGGKKKTYGPKAKVTDVDEHHAEVTSRGGNRKSWQARKAGNKDVRADKTKNGEQKLTIGNKEVGRYGKGAKIDPGEKMTKVKEGDKTYYHGH